MKLRLLRVDYNESNTIGQLYINDEYFCDVLEDKDRGLNQKDPESIKKKIYGQTAIPKGEYQIVISFSPRFKKFLPLLLNVPGYSGIRIHAGNTELHTEGCLLVGNKSGNRIINSRLTLSRLLKVLNSINKKEVITIVIE